MSISHCVHDALIQDIERDLLSKIDDLFDGATPRTMTAKLQRSVFGFVPFGRSKVIFVRDKNAFLIGKKLTPMTAREIAERMLRD